MNRYKNTKVINSKSYSQTIYPEIENKNSDIYIQAKDGDRLDLLAYKYYKDTSLWWVIAKANNLNGDSLFLDTPKRLRIPNEISSILNRL